MDITLGDRIGGGAFATVYEAEDNLGRKLAVKIISPSMRAVADAMLHARALARADHPNVVRVHAVTNVQDPAGSDEVEAIVMEYVDGETLSDFLAHNALTREQTRDFGNQLIAGVGHIHQQGLAHGDLHGGNVMFCPSGVKVLDILYSDSLALMTTTSRDDRLRQDLVSVRFLLSDLIRHSELDPGEATAFQNRLISPHDLKEINAAFNEALAEADAHGESRTLEFCWQRCLDDTFVPGPSFANAMLDETSLPVRVPLLKRLIEKDAVRAQHEDYILALWGAITEPQQREAIALLQSKLEANVPSGNWPPHIRTLRVLGETAWQMMSRVTRLKIEHTVSNDILSGYKDIYSVTGRLKSGVLGTWALNLGVLFEERDQLIDNIASMLRMNWYRQNYIGEHLFSLLPLVCDTDERRHKITEAIAVALENDARLVVNNLGKLPRTWQDEIKTARDD
ncbi:MAG: protein kinase [Kiritimatiellia bacterium]|jgi:serine/threonine-protein kinase RIO1|nr:protein kinase [Kiritimatiellia bacterium]